MTHRSVWEFVLPSYLALGVFLGGASSGGAVANAFLQLLGIAILWHHWIKWRTMSHKLFNEPKALIWLIALIGLWFIVQLVPLPPDLWRTIPGREYTAKTMVSIGTQLGWRPLAIEWERSIGALFSFIPPLACLIRAMHAPSRELKMSLFALLGATLIASVIGAAQLASGPQSPLYFYSPTTSHASSGFFANSNHFSTLFNICAAFAFVATLPNSSRSTSKQGGFAWIGWLGLALFFVANTFLNRSLAGLALGLLVACYGTAFIIGGIKATRRSFFLSIATTMIVTTGGVLFFILEPNWMNGSGIAQTTDLPSRVYFWETTVRAIRDSLPFGIGLGNFRWYFPQYEDPSVSMASFANHAHNDWLEFILEGGIFALAILAALGWVIFSAWRNHVVPQTSKAPSKALRLSAPYMVMAIIALHSIVDYPLRTATIAMIGAFALALALRGEDGHAEKN